MTWQSVPEMRKVEKMEAIFSIPNSSLASKQSLGDLSWPAKTQRKEHWEREGLAFQLLSWESELMELEQNTTAFL